MSIDSVAEKSNTPTSKYLIVTLSPTRYGGQFDYDRVHAAQA
jgi:hypothetical protein